MPEPVRGDQKYLPGLDGLRALAVAAVVAYHLGYGWAEGGLLGVGVFFTLSGYLITDILVGQWSAHGRIRLGDFWLRRARRLLPALFVMLAVVTVWVNVFARSFLPGFRGNVIASVLYVSNWWYIGQHASYYARFAPPTPLDHLWSLAVEEQFYLVWPWAVLLLVWLAGRAHRRGRGRKQRRGGSTSGGSTRGGTPYLTGRARLVLAAVTLGLAAGSAVLMARLYQPGYDPTRVYEGTDTRAFGLLIGAALAIVWPTRRPAAGEAGAGRAVLGGAGAGGTDAGGAGVNRGVPTAARWLLDVAGVTGLVVIGLLVWRTNQYSGFMFRGGLVLLSVATAAAVASAVTPGSLLGRALGCRPLRWLGVRSYGIYLWHYPLIVLMAAGAASGQVTLGRAAVIVAVTVAVAAVSWRVIEEPIRRGTRPSRARRLESPQAVGFCLLAATVLAAGVTASMRLTSITAASAGQSSQATYSQAGGRATASQAARREPADGDSPTVSTQSAQLSNSAGKPGNPASHGEPASAGKHGGTGVRGASGTSGKPGKPAAKAGGEGVTGTGKAGTGKAGTSEAGTVGPAAVVPALPTPPPRTSCTSVVHIGDSTSEGLISSDYLPNPATRITARYADVGVKQSIMDIVGATSVVESLPGTQNAYQMASQVVHSGYHGCWVLALGTNDTADVYVGSNVGRIQRIEKMMALIGDQPVMWVGVTSLLSSGPYAEQNMELWNQALQQMLPRYPNMRIYDWPAVARRSWFISDGIHYTSAGYEHRAKLIAGALANAFPAS